MLFFNISSDQIAIQGKDTNILVPYDDLERKLPEIVWQLNDKETFKKIWVLNGPGGFTILRIGCLALNTMQLALNGKLEFYSCTKLDLYKALVKKWFLPTTGIIFLWQKKNVRWATLNSETEKRETQLLPASSLEHMMKSGDFFVDVMYDHPLKEQVDLEKMISFSFNWDILHVTRQGKSIELSPKELSLTTISYLQPEYMIDPGINLVI